jgi:hypothetical protein
MIVFSDLHLRESSEDACRLVLDRIGVLATTSRDRHVVFCGDFWHIRYQVTVRLQNMVAQILRAWAGGGIRVDFVPGNHDQVDMGGQNALQVFDAFPHVRVWTEPGVDGVLGFAPYRKDPEEVRRMLASMVGSAGVIFAHFGVGGALMNNGHADDAGFVVPVDLPPIVLGHYHKRQAGPLGAHRWPIWQYVGSPYQTSYGEAGNVCGCLEMLEGVFPRFLPLDLGIPEHHIVTWDPSVSEVPPPRPGKPGDHVRLDIKASQEMLVAGKFQTVLKKHGLDDVQVNVVPVAAPREHRFALQTGETLKAAADRFAQERMEQGQDQQAVLDALGRWV